jgi:PadR family transcriptional regulator, regulatory protein PadR
MADHTLYRGLIRIHLLHHASREPIFGLGMIRELARHGHTVGPGTLYPILHGLESRGYLVSRSHSARSRLRRAYTITARGRRALRDARSRVKELFREVLMEHDARRDRALLATRRGEGDRRHGSK